MAQIPTIEPHRTVEKLIVLSSERARIFFFRRGNLYLILEVLILFLQTLTLVLIDCYFYF